MQLYGFDAYQIAGLFGVAFYLGSYAALQTGILKGSGYLYTAVNGTAATFVLISLLRDFNLSSALIQISWIVLSIFGLTRLYIVKNALRFTDKERFLISKKLPGLDNDIAKKFLKSGEWIDIESDSILIQHNEPISCLYFLHEGRAAIMRNNIEISTCEKGDFLGVYRFRSFETHAASA